MKVNLASLREVLSKHVEEKQSILDTIPDTPVLCGLFNINTHNMREMLADKHGDIIGKLLEAHQKHSDSMTIYLSKSFGKILKRLQVVPTNVEETTELEEFKNTISSVVGPLKETIDEMKVSERRERCTEDEWARLVPKTTLFLAFVE